MLCDYQAGNLSSLTLSLAAMRRVNSNGCFVAERISTELTKHASQYKKIIQNSLAKATTAPTTFKMAEGKSFTIDFYLRGEFTDPVGGQIDLITKTDGE